MTDWDIPVSHLRSIRVLSYIRSLPSFPMMKVDNRRRLLRDVDSIFFPIDYIDREELYFPTFEKYPIAKENMIVGSNFEHLGNFIYKSTRFSHNGEYAFETIFSQEDKQWVCWYTRVISKKGIVNLISTAGARELNIFRSTIDAVGNLIEPFDNPRKSSDTRITSVPFVHNNQSFYNYVDFLIEDCHMNPRYYNHSTLCIPLFEHNLTDLAALKTGIFLISPMEEIGHNPFNYTPRKYDHSVWDEIQNVKTIREGSVYINDRIFDTMVNLAIHTDFNFSVSIPVGNIINKIQCVNTIYDFEDPYRFMFGFDSFRKDFCDEVVKKFFEEALNIYLSINSEALMQKDNFGRSMITIIKRNTEEIAMIVYDEISAKTVCFYSCIPAIIMTTLALGTYDTK